MAPSCKGKGGEQPITEAGEGLIVAGHAVLRSEESLHSQHCGLLPQYTAVRVARVTPAGRALLTAPPAAAGRWASVVARSGHVVIAAPPGAAAPPPAAPAPPAPHADPCRPPDPCCSPPAGSGGTPPGSPRRFVSNLRSLSGSRAQFKQWFGDNWRPRWDAGVPAAAAAPEDETLVVSLGTFCLTAQALIDDGARRFAAPFDWLLTSPALVAHAVRDGCEALTDPAHLRAMQGKGVGHALYSPLVPLEPPHTPEKGTVFPHHDPRTPQGRAYFSRASERLRRMFHSKGPKLFVFVSPEWRVRVDDAAIDDLFAALRSRCARFELAAVKLRVARAGDAPATTELRRIHDGEAVLRVVDVSCGAGLRKKSATLAESADRDRLSRAIFGASGPPARIASDPLGGGGDAPQQTARRPARVGQDTTDAPAGGGAAQLARVSIR